MKYFKNLFNPKENDAWQVVREIFEQDNPPEVCEEMRAILPAYQSDEFYHGAAVVLARLTSILQGQGIFERRFVEASIAALTYSALRRQEQNILTDDLLSRRVVNDPL